MRMDTEQMAQEIRKFRRELKVERNLSEHTLKAYECDLYDLLRWGEEQQIFEWNDKTTLSYFTYLQEKKHLSARSIRRKYVSLRQFFRFLEESYEIHERIFRFSSRKFQIPKSLPKTLERTEIQRLLVMASNNFQNAGSEYQNWLALRDMCVLELLFSLGLRVGEAAALNVEDYRTEDQSVLIRGKGNKERILFLSSPVVCQKIGMWLRIRETRSVRDSSLFPSRLGSRMSIYGIESGPDQPERDSPFPAPQLCNPASQQRSRDPRRTGASGAQQYCYNADIHGGVDQPEAGGAIEV